MISIHYPDARMLLMHVCFLLLQLVKRLRHSSERVIQVELLKGDKGNQPQWFTTFLLLYAHLFLFTVVNRWLVVLSALLLWHCWFGVRKSIRPIKIEWWGAGMVIWLEQRADCLHMVQLMPLPSHNHTHCPQSGNSELFQHSGIGLPGLSWKRGR